MRTKRRAFIHAHMINYQRQHNGVAPSLLTIAKHFGIGKTAVRETLLSMADAGIVTYEPFATPAFTAIATPAVNSGGSWKYMPLDAAGGQE
ncbi:MAG: hypothetical protein KDD89_05835 [Anaerolineales bacterium]|nr:hypothetical protein [Anaerolineales bacterium]